MEPFFVTCETCRVRLKVRKPEAIGQIFACPRCESMVLIAPPTEAGVGGAAAASTSLRPRSQFARVDTPSQTAADMFAAAAVAVLAEAPARESADHSLATASMESSPLPAAGASSVGFHSLRGIWNAHPLAFTGVVSAALLTVGGLSIAVWPRGEAAPIAVVAATTTASETTADAPADAAAPNLPGADNSNVVPNDVASETKQSTPIEPAANSATIASLAPPAAAPEPEPIENRIASVEERSQTPQKLLSTTSDAGPSTPSVVTSPSPARAQVFKIDPLDFDPHNPALPQAVAPSSNSPPPVISESAHPSNNEVDLAAANIPTKTPGERPANSPSDTITVRRGTPPGDSPRRANPAAGLALPVRGLNMNAVPLSRFVEQMSDMAGTPITFDPSAVELTGVSPQRAIAVDAKETTIERVLRETLTRQRMDFVERNGQLSVVRAATSLPNEHDISDLAATEAEAKAVVRMIERFVAPDSWSAVGGIGELRLKGTKIEIKNSDEPVIGLILFCERLRIARGLPLKSRFPADRLGVESPYMRIAPRLERSTTFTFVPWTRLADVLRDWQTASGVTMLVDWSALAKLELGPASPISCSVIDRTWSESLDSILAQLGLGWWALDGETIQITSRERLAGMRRVEFHAVPKSYSDQFASTAAMIESLTDALKKSAGGDGNPMRDAQLAVDPTSGRLIALANAAAHRFLTRHFAGM
jgi:hypothetical protein